MNRFEQRLHKRLQNPDFAAGFWEMDAELSIVEAINKIRQQRQISTEDLARRMGRQRSVVSRLFNAEQPNPTLDMLSDLLKAMNVTAEIRFRDAHDDDPPIKVDTSGLPEVSA